MEKLERERNEARRMWSIHQDKLADARADIAIVILTARQNLPRKHGTIERIAEKYQENATGHTTADNNQPTHENGN
ncbi:hypothetical protein UFOVP736_63 [uncultured Caudovirales phage]|uniref:Uncharacterized protein n=1 Tax=uncultured Caudovirales phage TaxID=2100421 RepID=A0A6J5NMN8_9CAUD|nr:hypothetical protein UFOVP705_18 [uncultured Caudovirales phage]CAB5224370.1 hypothetical protein UFOVP736_63 [uncultured Caudovirales phage]